MPESSHTNEPRHLVVVADGNRESGMGHAMRSFAVAQAWLDGDAGRSVSWRAERLPASFRARLAAEGIALGAAGATDARSANEAKGAAAVLVDGYDKSDSFEQTLAMSAARLCAFDDNLHAQHTAADVVVNTNAHARPAMYAHLRPRARLALGPRYAPLRRELVAKLPARSTPERATRALVSFGGSDPRGLTKAALSLFARQAPRVEVTAVVGALANDAALAGVSKSARIVVDPPDMGELFAAADVAILGAGVTAYEAMAFGVPSLLVVVAENQRASADAIAAAGAATVIDAGDFDAAGSLLYELVDDAVARAGKSSAGLRLADGYGASRIAELIADPSLALRPATADDAAPTFAWTNDPATRAASFSTASITWDEHSAWLVKKLNDPRALLLIGIDVEDRPTGIVRFDVDGAAATISVNVAPDRRGGVGAKLVARGCREVARARNVERVLAHIKRDNAASLRTFEKAGFQMDGESDTQPGALRLRWSRPGARR